MITETIRDIHLFKAIAKCGFVADDLLKYYNIDKRRIRKLVNDGKIVKKMGQLIYGKVQTIYCLSPSLKKRILSEFLIYPYKTDLTQLEHDYCLSKIYTFLKLEEKESWITETGLRLKYPNVSKTCDAVFTAHTGIVVGVEVISNRYTKESIEQKKAFLKNYCDDSIIIKTH